ncbi:MAG: polyphenol oxidase family protein, partial [Chlamydiota bacterium]
NAECIKTRDSMIRKNEYHLFDSLAREKRLAHLFTTRRFAECAPPGIEGRRETVMRLRETLLPGARASAWGEQVHGKGVALVDGRDGAFAEKPNADALVTREAGVCLVAFGADCPIVFIADTRTGAIGLVHSGRKGTEARVATACLRKMGDAFGTSPADCLCAVSPSIGPCCYPVDLWARIEEELRSLGAARVENPRLCTACHPDLFFSYRREKGRCGRMLGALMITQRQWQRTKSK